VSIGLVDMGLDAIGFDAIGLDAIGFDDTGLLSMALPDSGLLEAGLSERGLPATGLLLTGLPPSGSIRAVSTAMLTRRDMDIMKNRIVALTDRSARRRIIGSVAVGRIAA
jgi:hypothetical protein